MARQYSRSSSSFSSSTCSSSGSALSLSWIYIILSIILCSSSLSWCYKERLRPNKYGVLRAAGGSGAAGGAVGMGEIMSNGIGEPSCEELRAMWRYHKRQSRRAELTNQIPSFEPIYWQLPPPPPPGTIKSFGGFKNFKLNGRSRSSYSHRHRATGPYGQINYFGPQQQQQQRQRLRPMEELIRMQPPKEEQQRPLITQPVVHLSPPASTPNSSFQQLQQLILEERQRQKGGGLGSGGGGVDGEGEKNNGRGGGDDGKSGINSSSSKSGGNNYGTLVLSPPHGQNGRLANKPPELMTPFEKLRFGHMTFKDEDLDTDGQMNDDPGLGPQLEQDDQQQQQQKRGLFYYPIRASRVREQQQQRERQEQMTRTTTSSPPVVSSSSKNPPSLPHSSIPSVFFWRRQFAPQDTPPSIRMVDTLPSCSLVQGLRCTLNQHCTCSGNGLYRCFHGQCHFLSTALLDDDDDGEDESNEGLFQFGPFYSRQKQEEEEEEVGDLLGFGNNEWETMMIEEEGGGEQGQEQEPEGEGEEDENEDEMESGLEQQQEQGNVEEEEEQGQEEMKGNEEKDGGGDDDEEISKIE